MNSYWKMRIDEELRRNDLATEELVKALIPLYNMAREHTASKLEQFYGRYSQDNCISISEAKKRLTPLEVKEFKSLLNLYVDINEKTILKIQAMHKRAYILRQEALLLNIDLELEKLMQGINETFNSKLNKTYEQSYYQALMNKDLYYARAFPFSKLNTGMISKAVMTKWDGKNYSDRLWADKSKLISSISHAIPRAFAMGTNPRKVAKQLRDELQTDYKRCCRIARTEINYIANIAKLDTYKNDELYQIDAHLDSRTSEVCRSMNGKVFKRSQAIVGITAPPFHPNCRTITVPYFDDLYTGNMAIFEDMTMPEWQKWRKNSGLSA